MHLVEATVERMMEQKVKTCPNCLGSPEMLGDDCCQGCPGTGVVPDLEAEPRLTGPPGGFQKGHDPRRGPSIVDQPNSKARKRPVPPEVILSEDGADPSLMAMRFVDVNHRAYDRTERHYTARKLKEDSPEKFINLLMKMEESFRIRTLGSVGMEKDIGEERARELIDKLLKGFAEREAGR
jgi:hypothetical protein